MPSRAVGDARLVLASAARSRRWRALAAMPPTETTTTTAPQAPQAAPQAAPPPAFEFVDGRRLRLRARDGAAVVELGVVARAERRLLVAVHAGRIYVGIAPFARGRGHRRRDRAGRAGARRSPSPKPCSASSTAGGCARTRRG